MGIDHTVAMIERKLTWRIKKTFSEGESKIISDPWEKVHTIFIPLHGTRQIEYLHELGHALLAENHHLLSTAYFESGTPAEKVRGLIWIFRAASDWYADHLLMEWVPKDEAEEIREHLNYVLSSSWYNSFILYAGGLILAQGVFYLGVKRATIPPVFYPVVDILINTPPDNPSVMAKMELVNSLARITNSLEVELTTDRGVDVWRIKR